MHSFSGSREYIPPNQGNRKTGDPRKKGINTEERKKQFITEKRNPRMTAAQQAYKTTSPDQSRNECSGEMYTRLKWV